MSTPRYIVRGLDRGLMVLLALARARTAMSLADLAKHTDLDESTTYRLLATLENRELVRRGARDRGYQLGIACAELGGAFTASLDVVAEARSEIAELCSRFQQTAHIGVLDGDQVLYLERAAPPDLIGPMIARPGLRTPAHCTAVGKAIAAYLPDDLRDEFLAHVRSPCTENSIVDRAPLEHELATIRQRGFSVDLQELVLGVQAAAAPIFDSNGIAIAGLSVGGLQSVLTTDYLYETVGPQLRDNAARVTNRIGGIAPRHSRPQNEEGHDTAPKETGQTI